MPAPVSRRLTPRQKDVIDRIDRRMSIKVIAQDLGMSETRVNQHIRALKDIYGAESLNELVEIHRKASGRSPSDDAGKRDAAPGANSAQHPDSFMRELMHADSGALGADAETMHPVRVSAEEPRVSWQIFDGPNGTVMRLFAIMGLAIGIIGIFFLVTAVSVTLSDALEATRSVPAQSAE